MGYKWLNDFGFIKGKKLSEEESILKNRFKLPLFHANTKYKKSPIKGIPNIRRNSYIDLGFFVFPNFNNTSKTSAGYN